jgi:hypothetical protein
MCRAAVAALALTFIAGVALAGEIGHFNGGIMNIRDYRLPEPGFYAVAYNYFYSAKKVNDANGNQITSFTAGGQTIGVSTDLNAYALVPALMWVTDIKSIGLRYGVFVSQAMTNSDLNVDLTSALGNRSFGTSAGFGLGDMFVSPFWIAKSVSDLDFGLSYGFYAPDGRYSTEVINIPGLGARTIESSDNIGLGFWTHQFQGIISWALPEKGTAANVALTYELNTKKKDFDLTPGNVFTLNYGVSQYLPLTHDQTLLLELGPTGYNSWQVTADKGTAASATLDNVSALGGQIGLTYVPLKLGFNVLAFFSYAAQDRPQGPSFSLNLAKMF